MIIDVSERKRQIRHTDLSIKCFPVKMLIGQYTYEYHCIKLHQRPDEMIRAATLLTPNTRIIIDTFNGRYQFQKEQSGYFCHLLKEGTTDLTCDRNKFQCMELSLYLLTGKKDLRKQFYTIKPASLPFINTADNTGKHIMFADQLLSWVHTAMIINKMNLTLSYLGEKGLYFCELEDLVNLYSEHVCQPLTIHELMITPTNQPPGR